MLMGAEGMNSSAALILRPRHHPPLLLVVPDTVIVQHLNSEENMKINETTRHHLMGIAALRNNQ